MPSNKVALLLFSAAFAATAGHAHATERIENGVAVFSALDKVTATIKKLNVPLGETVEFGALRVTPRACFSRPPTEQPKTTTFVEVDEVQLDGQQKRIFTGWMFAESPGLNAVEHPVFDVWLTACDKPKNAVAARATAPTLDGDPAALPPDGTAEPTGEDFRRRVRR
ncbi:MAG: DUF2155 domain-containing protein [Hyphomicrobium sp.]|nr:DUF2155 domain-containing protein [Hyphomicrobium sp.]